MTFEDLDVSFGCAEAMLDDEFGEREELRVTYSSSSDLKLWEKLMQ